MPEVWKYVTNKSLLLKAVLFVDNNPHDANIELKSGNITVKFFLPSVISLLQLLDQSVLEDVYKRQVWQCARMHHTSRCAERRRVMKLQDG